MYWDQVVWSEKLGRDRPDMHSSKIQNMTRDDNQNAQQFRMERLLGEGPNHDEGCGSI
jgi:hypothetical protein